MSQPKERASGGDNSGRYVVSLLIIFVPVELWMNSWQLEKKKRSIFHLKQAFQIFKVRN